MGAERLIVGQHVLQQIMEHCLEEKPYEACGVLTGRDGQVYHAYATDNAKRSPIYYEVDHEQQHRILRSMAERGEHLVAIYHSHPTAPAVPSASDIRLAVFYPEAIRIIVSLAGPTDIRAYRITNGRVYPVSIWTPCRPLGEWHDFRAIASPSPYPAPGSAYG